jgi:ferric-dicitrate binding protein FerR (iron transport regulator)
MAWKDFMQQYYSKVLAGEEASDLNEDQKRKVWQRLQEQHFSSENTSAKEVPLYRRAAWLPWMAAACVLLITGVWLYQSNRNAAPSPTVIEQPLAVNRIVKKNTGAGEESWTLPDRSTVILAPGSSVRYLQHFEASARNIELEGRALFEVTHDPAKPFTVTAHGFATTALGTRFIVDGTKPIVAIRLLKGKIVVNATPGAGMAMQKVYLAPGQELRINTTTKHVDKVTLGSKQANSKTPESDNNALLSFERTSLAEVFDRLSKYYKTTILYDKGALQGLSFTGDFSAGDKLELALKVICNSNRLSFAKEHDRIVISKQ